MTSLLIQKLCERCIYGNVRGLGTKRHAKNRSLKGKGLKDMGTQDKITVKRPTWVKGEMG